MPWNKRARRKHTVGPLRVPCLVGRLHQQQHLSPLLKAHSTQQLHIIAPYVWNNLPQHIREAGYVDAFKSWLKTFLFLKSALRPFRW